MDDINGEEINKRAPKNDVFSNDAPFTYSLGTQNYEQKQKLVIKIYLYSIVSKRSKNEQKGKNPLNQSCIENLPACAMMTLCIWWALWNILTIWWLL